MLGSVPDTPFGHALGQFMLLFNGHLPFDEAALHAAFAALRDVAAREHPDRPWPLPTRHDNGAPAALTVEFLLGLGRARYARLPVVPAGAVGAALRTWHGARVEGVEYRRVEGPGLRVDFMQAADEEPRAWGTLFADCAWQALPATPRRPRAGARGVAHAKALVGAVLVGSQVGEDGRLTLAFSTGSRLEVVPGAPVWKTDYDLHLDGHYFHRFAGTFVERVPHVMEPDDFIDSDE
ncbi:hypothetical protein [Hymenobacter arizonensis]|uniref:Uncharacterized protein n=1 Tax=Hymenobacter arizonensis TaxID=1227077 RepID=A0A1I6BCI3_HYMAR|nr:hypothetical protein [Hymenobacter arizonensis]SFQ78653.1 hypothetical protein SAMN04515668_4348 [Hymenobacter arizonensis]